MMCLDTNIVIGFLNGRSLPLVQRFRDELLRGDLVLPVVTLFELRYGVAKSSRRKESTDRLEIFLQLPIAILPFEAEDAEEAGDIRAELERMGAPIGPYDVLIAAQARRRDATLVTANLREFTRVPRLRAQDWALS